jgi:amino acid adenylation domain-containing protein
LIAGVEHRTLVSGFLRSVERFPRRPALDLAGTQVTYEELHSRAVAVAATLARTDDGAGPQLTAVFGSRSRETFAGILGALLHGHGYVPLNPRYPDMRNVEILARSGCRTLVTDETCVDAAARLVTSLADPPRLITPADVEAAPTTVVDARPEPLAPAYLLFTSGSTGRPKGVLVTQANVRAFLDAVDERYAIDETDRLSQLFDLTFDLSAFDLFAAWENGACVCCPTERQRLEPSRYIRAAELSIWFSVPSVAMLMRRLRTLKPGAFPSLRLSLFCGEALPADLADAWAAAAPRSAVDNLYGPTEATIACTAYRWKPGAVAGANGLVPIGRPLAGTDATVVDDALAEVDPGRTGQLLLTGPQVVAGYLDDPAATAAAFVTTEGGVRGYLTGDRVVEPATGAPLEYLGRTDSQVKILGHRVELGEVEAVLREESGGHAVAVGWPRTPSGAAGIVAFVADPSLDPVSLRHALERRLPDYMVPHELRLVGELPLNANGKHDRNALIASLESA